MTWKYIGLTCVRYPEGSAYYSILKSFNLILGDLIGKLLAYSSVTPIYIIIAFVTLIFFKRDVHTVCGSIITLFNMLYLQIFYFLGILLNELCNMILKNIIGQSRPIGGT